jgi:hypothetical protein
MSVVVSFTDEPFSPTNILAKSTNAGRTGVENINQMLMSLVLAPVVLLSRRRPFASCPASRKHLI